MFPYHGANTNAKLEVTRCYTAAFDRLQTASDERKTNHEVSELRTSGYSQSSILTLIRTNHTRTIGNVTVLNLKRQRDCRDFKSEFFADPL